MSGLKIIKRRIRSVKSTQQITRVMKMVAAAKLRRAQDNIVRARPYSLRLRRVIREVSARIDRSAHPLLALKPQRELGIVVVTGDRGLCGSFNTNILRRAQRLIDENKHQKVFLFTVGKRGTEFFTRRGASITHSLTGLFNHLHFAHAQELADEIIDRYHHHDMDHVVVVYNEFKSAIQQNVVVESLLPIVPDEGDNQGPTADIIYEPSELEILNSILPQFVEVQLWRIMQESFAAEMGARMTAMESATNNAQELIESLTLTYNKVRQASITNEILEVVAGAESLR
jgi:F-type H+-transporting ATPase subunit gamma